MQKNTAHQIFINYFTDYIENEDNLSNRNSPDVVDVDIDMFADNKKTMAASSMQGYKSALAWLYEEKRIQVDKEINSWLDIFIQGYKRTISDKKEKGVMDINEGREPFSFPGYCRISKAMISKDSKLSDNYF